MDFKRLLHRGEKFAARGAGLFIKDVMHDGKWIHPVTNATIIVTKEIRASVQKNMKDFLANGNEVPMPDGHTDDTAANKGFWPGPFVSMGDDVLGMAKPLDTQTIKQMKDGTANAVSVKWYSKYVDAGGVQYDDVFEHVCLTNYPVIGRQRNFISLDAKPATDAAPAIFDAELLKAVAVPEEDEKLLRALDSVYEALTQATIKDVEEIMKMEFTQEERIAYELAYRSMDLAGQINSDGTFKGGFSGCVKSGKSKKLCAYIGRRAGKIK